jgi:hypothetical protein
MTQFGTKCIYRYLVTRSQDEDKLRIQYGSRLSGARPMPSNPVGFGRDLATGFRTAQGFVSADPKSRRTDGRLSNSEHDTITGGHRATTTHDPRSAAIPHPVVSPMEKAPIQLSRNRIVKLKKLNRKPYQDVVVSYNRSALKSRAFQIGTFGTEVTTRPRGHRFRRSTHSQ